MKPVKRISNGSHYYSFLYTDPETGKRIRLKKSEHPHFTELAKAEIWAKSHEAYQHSQLATVRLKMVWLEKYADFAELIPQFEAWQAKRAPNSYAEAVRYLKHYVFPFFLTEKHENNVNHWHTLHTDFLLYLEAATAIRGGNLSYSSKNNCVAAYNSFTKFLLSKNLIHPSNVTTCPKFGDHLVTRREIESVIEDDEFERIYQHLLTVDTATADFWLIARGTGMRFNELFGLDIGSLYKGHTTGSLHAELEAHKIEYYGVIVLQDQPESAARLRDDKGVIARKPLKSRKTISPKNNRTIPIMDKEVWNTLARRHIAEKAKMTKGVYGSDIKNYVFFDDTNKSRLGNTLREACETLNLPLARTYHDLRHTFTTMLVGKTRSFFLTKTILGHRSDAFDSYNHIFEMVSLKAKQQSQEIDFIS